MQSASDIQSINLDIESVDGSPTFGRVSIVISSHFYVLLWLSVVTFMYCCYQLLLLCTVIV